MESEKQVNLIAEGYDENRRRFIPCYDAYYGETTAFLAASLPVPKRILDLGAGTGLLSSVWYHYFDKAVYVLMDSAEDMLQVARKRFAGKENISYLVRDYAEGVPDDAFDTIISSLSIHHLESVQKEALFQDIYAKLPVGGIFVNYDQFCAGTAPMNACFDSYWVNQLKLSGLTEPEFQQWYERRKLDRECSMEEEQIMLEKSGFRWVKCIFVQQKFAVLCAMKTIG